MAGEARDNYTNVITRKDPTTGMLQPLTGVRVTTYKLNADGSRPVAPTTVYATRAGGGPMTQFDTVDGQMNFWLDPGDWEFDIADQTAPKRIADQTIGYQAFSAKQGGIQLTQLPGQGEGYGMTGEIRMWGGVAAPSGWLLCQGQTLDGSAGTPYASLYAVIGTAWGGSGQAAFQVPDLRSSGPVGVGQKAGTDAQGRAFTSRARGAAGGTEQHTLQPTESGVNANGSTVNSTSLDHLHSDAGNGQFAFTLTNVGLNADVGAQPFWAPNNFGSRTGGTDRSLVHAHALTPRSADAPHNNMPPFVAVHFIIKL